MEKTNVLLLGESAVMAVGLRHVLDATNEYAVVGACATDSEALSAIEGLEVSLCIMELHRPVQARCELLKQIKATRPNVRLIVITDVLDAGETAAVVLAGADGLLDAAISPDALIAVLRLLQDKVRFVTSHTLWPSILEALSAQQHGVDRGNSLTRRETDVFELLRDGLTDREIAEVLTLSLWTVKHHVVNILQKLDMTSRREASRTQPRTPPLPPVRPA